MTKALKFTTVTVIVAILALVLAAFQFCIPNKAYADGEYTYTVRLLPGDQGTGGKTATVHYGDSITLDPYSSVTLPADSKYYIKGVRLSGHDNSEALANLAITVTEDRDYVVAYGIKGNQVGYTVRYVDASGADIATPQAYTGNVGDRPVVAYAYVEGYLPQAYNLTGSLGENAEDNTFVFTYAKLADGQEEAAAEVAAAVNAEGVDAATTGEILEAITLLDENGNPLAAPESISEINDVDNPLADGNSTINKNDSQILIPGAICACIVLAGLIIFLVWLFRRKKQQA